MSTLDDKSPVVAIVMGSKSDLETMKRTQAILDELGIACEARVYSAHRTPDALDAYLATLEERGIKIVIAAAGGAAHLAGVIASKVSLPVLGVPMQAWALDGLDSLLSTVQMPKGVPVATFAIGSPGAVNAGLFAARILALSDPAVRGKLDDHRRKQAEDVLADQLD
ncbi:MAG: 5-(carboxyamino)imidazole ribonucleotide mutase [Phycisphaerales bacterium]|nr:5-(carboxyamino)imidazole ribonucleotide mutase [Phycisphaerales bacterium]